MYVGYLYDVSNKRDQATRDYKALPNDVAVAREMSPVYDNMTRSLGGKERGTGGVANNGNLRRSLPRGDKVFNHVTVHPKDSHSPRVGAVDSRR